MCILEIFRAERGRNKECQRLHLLHT